MKQHFSLLALILVLVVLVLPACEVVEGIFKAGMWTAFIIVALVVGLIIWIMTRLRRK